MPSQLDLLLMTRLKSGLAGRTRWKRERPCTRGIDLLRRFEPSFLTRNPLQVSFYRGRASFDLNI